MEKGFAGILKQIEEDAARKLASKVPEWAGAGIEVPQALNLEQCSSQATSAYKAQLAFSLGAKRIADLTGGLGVDCWAFSRIADAVLHNERDAVLSAAVRRNYTALGVQNASFTSLDADSPACCSMLRDFKPDMVFLDPARRSASGSKLFLLEECSPNVLVLLPTLFEICPIVMVKLSPMADISMVAGRLGEALREVHVIGTDGECKELLCILEKGHCGGWKIIASDLKDKFTFSPEEEKGAYANFEDAPESAEYIFVPSPVLQKAGAFKLICSRLQLKAFSPDSHLYSCKSPEVILGKAYRILEVLPLNGRTIKEVGKRYPLAEVTSRGVHIRTDELRKRLGVKPGGDIHIFAATCAGSAILVISNVPKL